LPGPLALSSAEKAAERASFRNLVSKTGVLTKGLGKGLLVGAAVEGGNIAMDYGLNKVGAGGLTRNDNYAGGTFKAARGFGESALFGPVGMGIQGMQNIYEFNKEGNKAWDATQSEYQGIQTSLTSEKSIRAEIARLRDMPFKTGAESKRYTELVHKLGDLTGVKGGINEPHPAMDSSHHVGTSGETAGKSVGLAVKSIDSGVDGIIKTLGRLPNLFSSLDKVTKATNARLDDVEKQIKNNRP